MMLVPISVAALPSQADSDEQAIRLWLHGKAGHSRRAYESDIARFRQLIPKSLPNVSLQDLQWFAESLKDMAASSRKRTLATVKSLLTFCHRIGYVRFNVGAALMLPRPKRLLAERIMQRESVVRMMALERNTKKRAMLRFLYETGARASELCGLKWRDLQPRDNGMAQAVIYGKGDITRVVLFSSDMHHQLQQLRGDAGPDSPVFRTRTGKPMDQPSLFRIVRAAARHVGLKEGISPHWLRHACASHALDAGAPISLVKEQLGHASLETTSGYVHARPGDGLFNYLR